MIVRPHFIEDNLHFENNNKMMFDRSLGHSGTVNECTSSLTETRNSALVEDSHCNLTARKLPQQQKSLTACRFNNQPHVPCALFGANVGLER
jgi:hypothetical protein